MNTIKKIYYLKGITNVVVDEAKKLIDKEKSVCIVCNLFQQKCISKKYPELAEKVTFKMV